MNLENIMLTERSKIQKDRYCMTPLMWYPVHKFRDRKQIRNITKIGRERDMVFIN